MICCRFCFFVPFAASCRVKSLFEPPSHDVSCVQEPSAAPLFAARSGRKQQQPALIGARDTGGEAEREARLTFVTQTPGQPLVSGSIVGECKADLHSSCCREGSCSKLCLCVFACLELSGPGCRAYQPRGVGCAWHRKRSAVPGMKSFLHPTGIQIFYPGLAGRLLQTCCATKEPPHIVYCEEATEAIAAECWFQLQVQQVSDVLACRLLAIFRG